MGLYFFINHVLRRFVAKNDPSKVIFAELSSLDDREQAIFNDSICLNYLLVENEITDVQIVKSLSRIVLAESSKIKSTQQQILYNELLFINKNLNKKIVKEKNKLTWANTRYLFLVVNHYLLENHVSVLLSDLMKDQIFFFSNIKRIINYPIFRDWVTMRTQINNKKNLCLEDANDKQFYMTQLYAIFIMELYQSNFIDFVRDNIYLEILSNPATHNKGTQVRKLRNKIGSSMKKIALLFYEAIREDSDDYECI